MNDGYPYQLGYLNTQMNTLNSYATIGSWRTHLTAFQMNTW